MHNTAADEAVAGALLIVSSAQTRCGTTKVVAIDGPSGAGKTDFAAALAQRLPTAQILHMDDLYPGWDGLTPAVAILNDHILAPLSRGERATYRRWDWEHHRYAESRAFPSTSLLLVEGVGSGALPGWHFKSGLIWLEADRDERFRRGIERDGESYLPHWQRWSASEDAHFEVDRTRDRADLVVNTSS